MKQLFFYIASHSLRRSVGPSVGVSQAGAGGKKKGLFNQKIYMRQKGRGDRSGVEWEDIKQNKQLNSFQYSLSTLIQNIEHPYTSVYSPFNGI